MTDHHHRPTDAAPQDPIQEVVEDSETVIDRIGAGAGEDRPVEETPPSTARDADREVPGTRDHPA